MIAAIRVLIGALGVAGATFGAIELLGLGIDNLRAAGIWLVAGVVLHDAVLAPLIIGLSLAAVRVWRGRVPAAVVGGAVVLGTVTLAAVPVLGRFGARPDNPTLLDRPYGLGWLAFAALTWTVVGVALAVDRSARRPTKGGERGPGAGGR